MILGAQDATSLIEHPPATAEGISFHLWSMNSFTSDTQRLVLPLSILACSLHLTSDENYIAACEDPLLCGALVNACYAASRGSGTQFERVVGIALAMRVRALCAIGVKHATCQQLFGDGVLLHETLAKRTFSLDGCQLIKVDSNPSGDLLQFYAAHVHKRKPLEIGVYVIARDGPPGRWDILAKLGDVADVIALQCKFAQAKVRGSASDSVNVRRSARTQITRLSRSSPRCRFRLLFT